MDGASVAFSAQSLLGPVGGLLGLAFGAGSAAGWAFALRTVHKMLVHEREQCEHRVTVLEEQVRNLNEKYTSGLERSLAQIRDSSYRMMYREGHEDGA